MHSQAATLNPPRPTTARAYLKALDQPLRRLILCLVCPDRSDFEHVDSLEHLLRRPQIRKNGSLESGPQSEFSHHLAKLVCDFRLLCPKFEHLGLVKHSRS